MSALSMLLENSHPTVKLTPKELKLLNTLSDKTVVSRATFLNQVYNWSNTFANKATYKDTRAVDMAIVRLKRKIEPTGLLIMSVRGSGYRLIEL